jgi:hypothetical protein
VAYGGTPKTQYQPRRRNRYSPPAGTSYSVYARFRKTRVALARHLDSWNDAVGFAARVAAERFHDPGDVFIVDDHTGFSVAATTRAAARLDTGPPVGGPFEHEGGLAAARAKSREQLAVVAARLAELESTLARIRERRAVQRRTAGIPMPACVPLPIHDRVVRCLRDAAASEERQQQLQALLERSAAQLRRSYDIFAGRTP